MQVLTASSIPLHDLADVFNQAFSDYLIEVYFTDEALGEYINRHGIGLDTSLVIESDGFIVGLLLSGSDGTTTWNAGMGIHPRWRRRGLGSELLDEWLAIARTAKNQRALLEVIVQNLVASNLYRTRGFGKVRSYQGFEGRPQWQRGPAIQKDAVEEVRTADLIPVYRKGHSWQKRPEVMERLNNFIALRTRGGDDAFGEGYLIYENTLGLLYVFDCIPNKAGRALLEHVVRREEPRQIRVVNSIDLVEEDFYRRLGFKPWIRNMEMVVNL